MLLARIDEAFPLTCPQCVAEMRIVAFLTAASTVQRILDHIGEPATPPRIAPARGPPSWEEDDSRAIFLDQVKSPRDPLAHPDPDFEFDQRVSW